MLPAEKLLTEICKHGNVNKKYYYECDLLHNAVTIYHFHKIWPDDKQDIKTKVGKLELNLDLVWNKIKHFDFNDPKFNVRQVIDFIEHTHKHKV